jgi:hypothetical protein
MPLTGNVMPTFGMKLERHDRSPRQPRQSSASTLLKKDLTTLSVQQSHALLKHISPLSWEHINLTGIYAWDTEQEMPEGVRSLRLPKGLFRAA